MDKTLVWLLFRLIDLFIIVGLVVYAFVHWGLPWIKKMIQGQVEKRRNLKQSIQGLHEQADALDQQLNRDVEQIERLEHQVHVWQETIKRKNAKREAEKNDNALKLQKKYLQREQALQEKLVHDKVVPQALKQATDELIAFYNEEENRAFVQHVVDDLREENR